MLGKIPDLIVGYLKGRPYWSVIEPFVVVALVWGTAQSLAFGLLASSSALNPTIGMFLTSYLSIRITIVAIGVVAILLILRQRKSSGPNAATGRIAVYWQANRRGIVYRALGIALVLAALGAGFIAYSPNRVSHITVRFASLPADARPEALAYLIYELNRRQRHWQYHVDFKPATVEELPSTASDDCGGRPQLCLAEFLADGRPFIAITRESLGGAYFAEHRGGVSVISTDKAGYEPLSVYEYLVYCLILQSIVIHLDLQGGLPADAFAPDRLSRGGLFQFIPERQALKSSILAARLSPDEEALLLNTFGADYVAACAELLAMDWLYTDRVKGNLQRGFGVSLRSG
jgi:hypothetical protein